MRERTREVKNCIYVHLIIFHIAKDGMADGSANTPVTSRPVKQELSFQYIYIFVYLFIIYLF